MSETCAVCRKGKGPEKCEVCGFSDNGSINRSFPFPEDTKNWIETVVKPYHHQWEKAELLAQLEESRKNEAELIMQLEKSKKNVQMTAPVSPPQQETFSQTQPTPSITPKKQTSFMSIENIIVIIIILLTVFVSIMSLPDNASAHFKSGNEYYDKKDYDKAIEDYTAAIKIRPDDPVYLNKRGLAYHNKKDYDKAIEDFTAVIKLKPDDPVCLYNRSGSYNRKKDYDKAIEDVTAAIKLKQDESYFHSRGLVYHNKGDYNLAITDFEAALRINPNYDLAKENLNLAKTEYIRQTQSAVAVKNTLTDSRDNKVYKTVKIDNQVWMAENLNYNAPNSKCYNNNEAYCTSYGRLYTWATAKKACPSGWHLPNGKEWQTIVNFAGGEKIAGKKLKAKSGWDKDGNGTDDFDFSALPGGYGSSDGSFSYVGNYGYWWSSSEYDASYAYYRNMYYYGENADYFNSDKGRLQSVRCLQD